MSNALLSHGYYAVDTGRRDLTTGERTFDLRDPRGELVGAYYGPSLEAVLPEMERAIVERRRSCP